MSVTIISVGNGGFNIASDIIKAELFQDVRFIVCDTEPNDLERNSVNANDKYLLDRINQSEVKSSSMCRVDKVIENADDIIILCATLGGMTGSHYAPLIALNAKLKDRNVFSFISMPSNFEGERKRDKAQKALHKIIVASNLVVLQNNERLKNYDLGLAEMNKPIVDTLASIMSLTPSLTESQMLLTAAQQSEPSLEKQNALFDAMVGSYGLSVVSSMSLDDAQKYVPEKYQEEDKVEPLIWIKPDDYGAFTPEERCEVFN